MSKKYTYDEVYQSALKYFNGDELAATVWISKYSLKDSDGNIYELNPHEMHQRLTSEFERIEMNYKNPLLGEEILELLKDFKYVVPQGGPMSGIGNNLQTVSISNCFVVGNEYDSYGGLIKTDEEQVQLMKRRGGVGHDLSHIRPKGSPVKNSALTSTGIVPFMERYSNSTREVAQDGRRGALMLSVAIKHPDSVDFVNAKMEEGKVTGANISLRIDDEFMYAVKDNKTYIQQFPVKSNTPSIIKSVNAKDFWKKIVHNAWKSAEPGILFWDTIINESVPDCYDEYGYSTTSTNPCGEIPLCPYDSCRLIAINLYNYVVNAFTSSAYFDFDLFKVHVKRAMKMMDDIIDIELEKIEAILAKIETDPEPEEAKIVERNLWIKIKEKAYQGRRTGLGTTGEGDMLAALGLTYGTDEGNDFSELVHKTLAIGGYESSIDMAKERGAFPIYNKELEKNNPYVNRIYNELSAEYKVMFDLYGRRNIALFTLAPTGTTSICTRTTSGIEPVFLVNYKRRKKINPNDRDSRVDFVDESGDKFQEFNVFHHHFITWAKINGYDINKLEQMSSTELQTIINKSPYYKATSNDVDWIKKVELQGRIQKWIDHSISVTVNLPNNATEELVSQVYMKGWECGCKGITIYRDGSRSGVLISNDTKKKVNDEDFMSTNAPKRPKTLDAHYYVISAKGKKYGIVVGMYKDRPYEIFAFTNPKHLENCQGTITKVKKSQYRFECSNFVMDNVELASEFIEERAHTLMLSMLLRHRAPIEHIINVAKKIDDNITSFSSAVRRVLSKYIKETEIEHEKCPECSGKLIKTDGCIKCENTLPGGDKVCTYSKCG